MALNKQFNHVYDIQIQPCVFSLNLLVHPKTLRVHYIALVISRNCADAHSHHLLPWLQRYLFSLLLHLLNLSLYLFNLPVHFLIFADLNLPHLAFHFAIFAALNLFHLLLKVFSFAKRFFQFMNFLILLRCFAFLFLYHFLYWAFFPLYHFIAVDLACFFRSFHFVEANLFHILSFFNLSFFHFFAALKYLAKCFFFHAVQTRLRAKMR